MPLIVLRNCLLLVLLSVLPQCKSLGTVSRTIRVMKEFGQEAARLRHYFGPLSYFLLLPLHVWWIVFFLAALVLMHDLPAAISCFGHQKGGLSLL